MASVYDQLMKDAPYTKWQDFTKEVFNKSQKNIESIIDLGCGTGSITTKLASDGYEMIGVDVASDMLTCAHQKSNNKQLKVKWVQQDLRNLEGFSNLDAAISYCDVINYITTEEEVSNVFNRVAGTLKDGGLFLFDVHTLDHVQHNMINQTFAHVDDAMSYIWFCSEGDNKGEMHHDLTFFILEEGVYNRFKEYHHQRTYSIETYTRLLTQSGFENIMTYYDFSTNNKNLDEKSERVFFSAEKRSR